MEDALRALRQLTISQGLQELLGVLVKPCCSFVLCLGPDLDSGDLPLRFVVVVLTAQFRRNVFQSIGADDRTKGAGFQTQKSKGIHGWGQARKDELLAKAVVIDGRKEFYCRL